MLGRHMYIHGNNNWLFQVLGHIYPWLRTAMLSRQQFNNTGMHPDRF